MSIFFLLLANIVFAQEYDINDPRNPNCPCHKMQKLADDEFANLNNNKNNDSNIGFQNQDNKNSDEKDSSQKIKNRTPIEITYSGEPRKRKNVWIRKTKFRFMNKHKFKSKAYKNVALCYKWQ